MLFGMEQSTIRDGILLWNFLMEQIGDRNILEDGNPLLRPYRTLRT